MAVSRFILSERIKIVHSASNGMYVASAEANLPQSKNWVQKGKERGKTQQNTTKSVGVAVWKTHADDMKRIETNSSSSSKQKKTNHHFANSRTLKEILIHSKNISSTTTTTTKKLVHQLINTNRWCGNGTEFVREWCAFHLSPIALSLCLSYRKHATYFVLLSS